MNEINLEKRKKQIKKRKTMKQRKTKSSKNHKIYLKKTLRRSMIKKFLDSKKPILCERNVRPFEAEY